MCTPIASTNASLQFNNIVFNHDTEKQKYNHADSNDKTSGIYISYTYFCKQIEWHLQLFAFLFCNDLGLFERTKSE